MTREEPALPGGGGGGGGVPSRPGRGEPNAAGLSRAALRGGGGCGATELRGDGAAGSRGGISPCEGATPPIGMERESVGL